MKRLIFVVAMCLFLQAGSSDAQTAGEIRLCADIGGTECVIQDNVPGLVDVYMIVTGVDGVSAIQFAAPKPDCWKGATWLGDVLPFPLVIGDTQNNYEGGISIGLSLHPCSEGGGISPIYLGKISYMTQGTAETCCEYSVKKAEVDFHPEFDEPIFVYCDGTLSGISAGRVTINADESCNCGQPVPTQETTWGQIKALYR